MPSDWNLLALHGNGGGAWRFARVQPFLPPEVRFYAVTLPGFAALPADPRLRSMQDYAEYLHSLIKMTGRPRVLLGHGIGGSLVLEYVQHFAAEADDPA